MCMLGKPSTNWETTPAFLFFCVYFFYFYITENRCFSYNVFWLWSPTPNSPKSSLSPLQSKSTLFLSLVRKQTSFLYFLSRASLHSPRCPGIQTPPASVSTSVGVAGVPHQAWKHAPFFYTWHLKSFAFSLLKNIRNVLGFIKVVFYLLIWS